MTTAFAGAEQPDREALLSAPLRWPRPSALELALNAGTAKATEAAQQLGLHTIGDLLEHLPRDRRESRTVAALTPGESATVVVEVRSITSRSVRRRGMKPLVEATVADESGVMKATFFNQPWLQRKYTPGTRLVLHGKYEARNRFKVTSHAPTDERTGGAQAVAHYPATEGLSSTQILALVRAHLPAAEHAIEPLPARTPATTRRGAFDWPSTSCCSRSSRCCAAARSAAPRRARPCSTARPGCRGVGARSCCRSRSPAINCVL